MNWMVTTQIGEGDLLYSAYQFKRLMSCGNQLTDTPKNNVVPAVWESLSPRQADR